MNIDGKLAELTKSKKVRIILSDGENPKKIKEVCKRLDKGRKICRPTVLDLMLVIYLRSWISVSIRMSSKD